jgi:hypothetical protein
VIAHSEKLRSWLPPLMLVLIAGAIGRALRGVALDDPYVTYRYAENILHGLGPVYNPGERILSTTAFGYALVLTAIGAPFSGGLLPTLSNALSALGLALLALALWRLGARHGQPAVGFGSALLALLSPLLASTFGLETCLFLGLVGLGVLAFDTSRPTRAALLLAVATCLRADGTLAFATLAACSFLPGLISRREIGAPLRAAAVYAAIVLPYEALLTLLFGSPVPTTLAAKRVQATIGGWPDHLGGLRDLLAERIALSPLYWLAVPLGLLGLIALARWRWAVPLVLWGAVQSTTYQLLGVASYTWYYAPLVPAAALLVALGAAQFAALLRRDAGPAARMAPPELVDRSSGARGLVPGDRTLQRAVLTLVLLAPLAWAQLTGLRALRVSVPEPRALAYQRVGEWLDANLPPNARVAVMEVGIMGFYAHRPMVDLLGLIRPETIDALRRQDFFWTIADAQPEAVVLTGKNPLWFQNAEPGHWLYQYYASAERIDQVGFWGTPLTILRRVAPPRQAPELDGPGPGRFGDAIALERVAIERLRARPGDFETIQLYWRALAPIGRDYSAFVHIVTPEPRVVAQHDTPVVSSRWPVGQPVQYYHPMRLPPDLPPGRYYVEIGLYLPEAPLTRLVPLDRPDPRNVARVAELTIAP